jgi:polysaccharide deacetylase 2 family uncharacterized protein YibQ
LAKILEKYDKLITALLVVIAFVFGIGWWFAEEKSEPIYLSKIDRLMFDQDNKAPKFVVTLPDKLEARTNTPKKDVIVDVIPTAETKPQVKTNETFSLDKLMASVPNIYTLPDTTHTAVLSQPLLDETMVEHQDNGQILPIISAEGHKPWSRYGNTTNTQPNFKKVALVISGVGFDVNALEKMAGIFDSEVSFSLTPYTPHPDEALSKVRDLGHETYVDLLLASRDFLKEDTGPLSLTPNLTLEEAQTRFRQTISMPAPIGGVIVRDGFVDNASLETLATLLKETQQRGLLAIDASSNGIFNTLKIEGLAHRQADFVISQDAKPEEIEQVLNRAETVAFDKGQVLIVAEAKPIIILALYRWIQTFSPQVSYQEAKTVDITKPFALVPLSNLVVE